MDDIQVPPPPPMPSSALNTSPVPPPATPKPLTPTPSIPPVPPPPPPRTNPILSSTPKSGGSKKILGLLLGVLVLVAAAIGVAYFVKQSQASKVKTIVYWGLWEPEQVMRPLFDEFESTHPKIKIDYKMQSVQQYRERVTSAISQGTGPDIFRIHNTWTPMFKDLLAPVPATVMSADEFANSYYPVVSETLKVGSQYIAIPLEYDGLVMYVNDNLLRQTGLPVPQNWDELRKAAIAMSSCETETGVCAPNARLVTSGVALGTTENVDHWQDIISVLMMQNNVDLTNPNTQAASDVLQYYSNFTKELGIWNANVPTSTNQFAAGKVGIYFGPSWRYFDLKAMSPNLTFSVHPIPQLPYDVARGETPVNLASFWTEAVNTRSKNASESWELLKFLSDKSSLTKFHAEAAKTRAFGEPSPRQDMASDNTSDPVQSVLLQGAPSGKSWYLASATYDGETGINSQLSAAFAKSLSGNTFAEDLGKNVQVVLAKYGVIAPIVTPGK